MLHMSHFAAAIVALFFTVLLSQATHGASEKGKSEEVDPSSAGRMAQAAQQVERIDQAVVQAWQAHNVKPAPRADDGPWCRRLFLDVLGRIPTPAELDAFLAHKPRRDARARLVDQLLYSPEYQAERVDYEADVWVNLLIGRTGGTGNNSLANRSALRQFVRKALLENMPYQQLVQELLSAEGANQPDQPDYHGGVNYLLHKLEEGTTQQATAHISRLFLGRQVQCTQCHNHPFNDWKQNQFWELDAFLRQTVALRRFEPGTNDVRYVVLTDQDFRGEGETPDQAEVYFELRNGELRAAYPRFLDGQTISASGYLDQAQRRRALAQFVAKSEHLAPALVNRWWSRFLGYGFTKPVDDMGPHNVPSHPELLELLSQAFRTSGTDLRQLTNWIVLSKPYQLSSSVTAGNRLDDPQGQRVAWFSRFYLRQMTAEQLYQSLRVVTRPQSDSMAAPVAATADEQSEQQRWLQQFLQEFGTDEGGESTTWDGTIPQTLMMFHGEMMQRATQGEPGTWLAQVSQHNAPFPMKLRQLYWAALSRRPTAAEVNGLSQALAGAEGETQALQDAWWGLLNSNEFILNH